jgi:hypothetical protein
MAGIPVDASAFIAAAALPIAIAAPSASHKPKKRPVERCTLVFTTASLL